MNKWYRGHDRVSSWNYVKEFTYLLIQIRGIHPLQIQTQVHPTWIPSRLTNTAIHQCTVPRHLYIRRRGDLSQGPTLYQHRSHTGRLDPWRPLSTLSVQRASKTRRDRSSRDLDVTGETGCRRETSLHKFFP